MMLNLPELLRIKSKFLRFVMRKAAITVYGLVQGVGYRPFAAEAARELSICGTVCNNGGIVRISAYGDDEALDEYVRRLSSCAPKGSRVDKVTCEYEDVQAGIYGSKVSTSSERADGMGQVDSYTCDLSQSFEIVESEFGEDDLRFLPADIATCDKCERELFDTTDRRFRYPFISCVSCGPRFTIMDGVPYDRERPCHGLSFVKSAEMIM